MDIKISTKYNIGDVLYYANVYGEIVKECIVKISVEVRENKMVVLYYFDNRDTATEPYMEDCYSDTPEGAGSIIAQRAIKKMESKENLQ